MQTGEQTRRRGNFDWVVARALAPPPPATTTASKTVTIAWSSSAVKPLIPTVFAGSPWNHPPARLLEVVSAEVTVAGRSKFLLPSWQVLFCQAGSARSRMLAGLAHLDVAAGSLAHFAQHRALAFDGVAKVDRPLGATDASASTTLAELARLIKADGWLVFRRPVAQWPAWRARLKWHGLAPWSRLSCGDGSELVVATRLSPIDAKPAFA